MLTAPAFQRPKILAAAAAVLLAATAFLAGAADAPAQTPTVSPARATVFIRVVGDLELIRPPDQPGGERRLQQNNVELTTGSGVLISAAGHVLTAAHVVNAENITVTLDGVRVDVRQTVKRIEVLMAGDAAPSVVPLEASVLASDAGLDLAVLAVNGANLPFLDLGDSDALTVGDAVEAVGFPFGEDVEIARPRLDAAVAPAASVSRGNLSAFREDGQGERRFVQVTAALNVGNSGGPIVDADGYVVAVANSVMRSRSTPGAIGVGFGVSVNVVKRFLESYGLDSALRARRVTAGPASAIEGKGMRLALLVGSSDTSPLRARVDTGSLSTDGIALRVDRVLSPWPAARLADALVAGHAFEAFTPSTSPSQPFDPGRGRVLLGHAAGTMDDGTPARMEYAVLDAGTEKIVARFIGPPHQVAYNASVLRSALRQIDAEPQRAPGRALGPPLAWQSLLPPRGSAIDRVQFPVRWVVEPAGPFPCRGVPAAADAAGASPESDVGVALRVAWLPGARLSASDAAAACGGRGDDPSSYAREFTFLGVTYRVEGRFVGVENDGLLQLESVAPAEQVPAVHAIFARWTAKP